MSKNTLNNKKNQKTDGSKYVVVDCVSTFHVRYVVELPENAPDEWALDDVVMGNAKEFSQKHLDETIVTHRTMTKKNAVIKLARQDNPYVEKWNDDQLLNNFVTKNKTKSDTKDKVEAPEKHKSDKKKSGLALKK